MKVLVVDVGGTHVKILATGRRVHREFQSGPAMTPEQMVSGVQKLTKDWKYDVVSIGYPGPVLKGKPVVERITSDRDGSAVTFKLPSSVL